MTDPLGQSQVIPYLQGLHEKGYRHSIISFEKEHAYDKGKATIKALLDQADIQWVPLSYTKRPPVLSTLYDMNRMYRAAQALHREQPIQLLHARSYISAAVAQRLSRPLGIPWIFDMRGFYADERVDGNLWPQDKLLYKKIYNYFKNKEGEFLRESRAIISLTAAGKKIILRHLAPELSAEKIQVIPCCADLDRFDYQRFDSQDRERKRVELSIDQRALVVVYAGSVGTWYMLPQMLEWFSVLLSKKPDAVFLFLSADDELIRREAARKGIAERSIKVIKVPYAEVPAMLNAADFGMFFIVPTFSKQASSPTKMGEMMGMGLPLVCNTGVGDVGDIVEQSSCGMAIDINNPAQFQRSVESIETLPFLDKDKIRQSAFEFYSLKAGVERYAEVYERALQGSPKMAQL